MSQEPAGTLGVLIAKQAITEQIYKYCRGLDRMDFELAIEVWHPDGTADFSGLANKESGLAAQPIPIREHFERAWEYRRQFLCHSHQATNILIEVRGKEARSETASIAVLQRKLADGRIGQDVFWGRWLDNWSFRNGRWAIDHRAAVLDCYMPAIFESVAFNKTEATTSRRDRTDPSYALFQLK